MTSTFGFCSLCALLVLNGCLAAHRGAVSEKIDGAESFDVAWRAIYETYYDTTFNGVDWVSLRDDLRPRAARARDHEALRAVIRDMLSRLRQSHFVLIPAEAYADRHDGGASERHGDAGFDVRFAGADVVVSQVDSGAARNAGVRPGWILRAVDGAKVAPLGRTASRQADGRSVRSRARSRVLALLRGPVGARTHLEFVDGDGTVKTHDIERSPEAGTPITMVGFPTVYARVNHEERVADDGRTLVGIVRVNVWHPGVAARLDSALDAEGSAAGIILDLRGNRGGYPRVAMDVAGRFVDSVTVLATARTRGGVTPYIAIPRAATRPAFVTDRRPVAIIVDETSGSASESFAAGMQGIGRARVFGDTTAGAVLPSTVIRLPNGDVVQHAIGEVTGPGGVRLEGRGVIPDRVVPLRTADLLAGRDAALDAAVQWVASQRRMDPHHD